jgi:hypothetical protein
LAGGGRLIVVARKKTEQDRSKREGVQSQFAVKIRDARFGKSAAGSNSPDKRGFVEIGG